jgi:hypothetical protein
MRTVDTRRPAPNPSKVLSAQLARFRFAHSQQRRKADQQFSALADFLYGINRHAKLWPDFRKRNSTPPWRNTRGDIDGSGDCEPLLMFGF